MTVIVVGQAASDVLLRVDGLPERGGSSRLCERRRRLGGKGANQAVGLAQLGVPVALIAVLGADRAGAACLQQLRNDAVVARAVIRRGDTAVLVDLVDEPGSRRLFEQVPESQLLTADDIGAARLVLDDGIVDTMSLQLQQPSPVVLAAARWGGEVGAMVVADGAPHPDARRELLRLVDVLRMDAVEAASLASRTLRSARQAEALGRELLEEGPQLVAIAVPEQGNVLVWPGGSRLIRFGDEPVRDTTGGGDSFVAGLIAGLRRGDDPATAGAFASAAAASTVQRFGGRPDLRHLAPAAGPTGTESMAGDVPDRLQR